MRTTLNLDEDVYQAALHVSQASGQRFGKVVSILMRRALTPAETPVRKKKSRRFVTFEVPPDSPILPASRVQAAIDEEGLF